MKIYKIIILLCWMYGQRSIQADPTLLVQNKKYPSKKKISKKSISIELSALALGTTLCYYLFKKFPYSNYFYTAEHSSASENNEDAQSREFTTSMQHETQLPNVLVRLIRDYVDYFPSDELKGHTLPVRSAFFSPDGKRVITASNDKTACIWNVSTGKLLRTLKGHTAGIRFAAFSPQGNYIVTASQDRTARIWDARWGRLRCVLPHLQSVNSAAFSFDETRLITGSDDAQVRSWSTWNGAPERLFNTHARWITAVACHPFKARVASASVDCHVRIWNIDTGVCLKDIDMYAPVTCLMFSPDGKSLVFGDQFGKVRIWDFKERERKVEELRGCPTGGVNSVAYSSMGDHLLSAHNDTVHMWNAHNNQLVQVLPHVSAIYSAAFSPDGKKIITAHQDGSARIWQK